MSLSDQTAVFGPTLNLLKVSTIDALGKECTRTKNDDVFPSKVELRLS